MSTMRFGAGTEIMTPLDERDVKEEEFKEELMMHMAKTVVEGSVASQERIFGTVLGVSTVAVPAYTTVVASLEESVLDVGLVLLSIPILFWIISLLICTAQIFPRRVFYDFKNVPGIIDTHAQAANQVYIWGRASIVFLMLGVLSAAYIILYSGGLLKGIVDKCA